MKLVEVAAYLQLDRQKPFSHDVSGVEYVVHKKYAKGYIYVMDGKRDGTVCMYDGGTPRYRTVLSTCCAFRLLRGNITFRVTLDCGKGRTAQFGMFLGQPDWPPLVCVCVCVEKKINLHCSMLLDDFHC